MQSFEYQAPPSLEQAVARLAAEPERARPMAGGTDLLTQMREGRRQIGSLIDIKSIPELTAVTYHPELGLSLGAAASCYAICHHPDVVARYPGLVDGLGVIGAVQIQFRASVGGNLCNASPAADSIPPLIVHAATCMIVGPAGARSVPAEDFCVAPGRTVLQPGELLVSVQVPPPPRNFGAHYLRFIPRNEMDIAVANAAASVTLSEDGSTFTAARVAIGAVAPTPLFVAAAGEVLAGKPVSPESIAMAAAAARSASRPITDMRGSADQRRHLASVLTARVIETAVARARHA